MLTWLTLNQLQYSKRIKKIKVVTGIYLVLYKIKSLTLMHVL